MGGQLDELLASPMAARCRVCLLFSLYCIFIQCMVTNKYDSIKSICWNRPEQSGFRLCEVRGIYTVLTVEHTIEKVGSFSGTWVR